MGVPFIELMWGVGRGDVERVFFVALQREIKLKFDALYRSEQRNGGSPAQVMSFQKKLTSRWWGWWCGKCEFRNGRIILFQDWHSVEFLLNCLVLMNNQNSFFFALVEAKTDFGCLQYVGTTSFGFIHSTRPVWPDAELKKLPKCFQKLPK